MPEGFKTVMFYIKPSSLHFLVVDDHAITRLIIITILKKLGYAHVSEAQDGQKALHFLQSDALGRTVNFVISDWNMPIMGGLTLLRTIRTSVDLRHLPVLMVTANAEINFLEVAMEEGADGYLDKQFLSTDILKKSLDKIIMKRGLFPT